jgi:hypothetical protein
MVVMAEGEGKYQLQYGVTDLGSGAMRGAATGAMLGAKLGGPLFGAGGMLVGGGLGAVAGGVSNLIQGRDERQEMADLMRRREMGMLGLTDEERADAERALMDPQRAIMRQQTATAPQVDDAAIAARMLLGREQQEQQAERAVQTEISKLNMQERQMEEQRIAQIMESRKQAAAKSRQDTYYMAGQAMDAMADNEALRAKLTDQEFAMLKAQRADSKALGLFDNIAKTLLGTPVFEANPADYTDRFISEVGVDIKTGLNAISAMNTPLTEMLGEEQP